MQMDFRGTKQLRRIVTFIRFRVFQSLLTLVSRQQYLQDLRGQRNGVPEGLIFIETCLFANAIRRPLRNQNSSSNNRESEREECSE